MLNKVTNYYRTREIEFGFEFSIILNKLIKMHNKEARIGSICLVKKDKIINRNMWENNTVSVIIFLKWFFLCFSPTKLPILFPSSLFTQPNKDLQHIYSVDRIRQCSHVINKNHGYITF